MKQTLSTKQKALRLNLDRTIYGTFAEIGAGQEVAGFFFKAGGASGTVAKSMSAYDMTFSDSIYGKEESGRYVCQDRLERMLQHEYDLLLERLNEKQGDKTRFFALANTCTTKSFGSNINNGHSWMGIRFQSQVGGEYNQIILHAEVKDSQNFIQAQALGILGVNLVYGAFSSSDKPEELLSILMENLEPGRVELDMISFSGPVFSKVDNRVLNLELVKRGYCQAVMFNESGEVALAKDALYKKNIQIARGSFRPPTVVNFDLMETGRRAFANDLKIETSDITSIAEITMKNLGNVGFNNQDFLARVDLIASLGQKVLISNFPQYYKLTNYLTSMRARTISLILGGYNFKQIFDEQYNESDGGVFSALGQLFKNHIRIYVYPYKDDEGQSSIDINNLEIPSKYKSLYLHLIESRKLFGINDYDESILHIYSSKVLKMIQDKEDNWERFVPKPVAQLIKDQKLFGYGE